jgi:hypothetical protein
MKHGPMFDPMFDPLYSPIIDDTVQKMYLFGRLKRLEIRVFSDPNPGWCGQDRLFRAIE